MIPFFKSVLKDIQVGICRLVVAISFVALPVFLWYVIHYSLVSFDLSRAVVGCVCLYTLIHLNQSM